MKASLCLEAAERPLGPRLHSLGRPSAHGKVLGPVGVEVVEVQGTWIWEKLTSQNLVFQMGGHVTSS